MAAVPILIAITFHEVAHGFVANRLGDPTAKMLGRLTLNPIVHIDIIGTVLLPALLLISTQGQFVFGYAKPVPINPMNFSNPRRDMALSAAAGPVTNILLALASVIVLKLILAPLGSLAPEFLSKTLFVPLIMIFYSSAVYNIVLAVFNMIPVPPLDGGRVLTGLLPTKQAISFEKIEQYGFLIVILLLVTGIAQSIIWPVIAFFLRLFRLY
jgi:Zn-dependent protease